MTSDAGADSFVGMTGRWLLSAGLLVSLLSGGCATVISGTRQAVWIECDAPNATVRVDGAGEAVALPARVELSRRSASFLVEAPAHHSAWVQPGRRFNVISLLNLLAFGVLGMAVDAGTGAIFRYPDVFHVRLEADGTQWHDPASVLPVPTAVRRDPDEVEDEASDEAELPPPPLLTIPPDGAPPATSPADDRSTPDPMEPRPL